MLEEFTEAVLDASIMIQTLVREKYTDIALKLVSILKTIYLPSLTFYEIGNTLVILTHKNLITKEDAKRKFNYISSIPTLNIREAPIIQAIDIAIDLKITLYDASYLALALEVDAPLITADNELYEKGKTIAKVIRASDRSLFSTFFNH